MKYLFAIIFSLSLLFAGASANSVSAVDPCTATGQCHDSGWLCRCDRYGCYPDSRSENNRCGGGEGQGVIGNVTPPVAITNWSAESSTTFGGIAFLSTLIRLITIVAGIFVMFNFVAAGFKYVTSMGNTSVNMEVRDKLLFSVIGLLIIVSAYTIAGLIGLIFFGDAAFILRPTLTGALDL